MKIWIMIFALFLSGAGIAGGIILDRKVLKEKQWMPGPRPGGLIDKYSKELEITADQQATIDGLRKEIEAKDKEIHALREKTLNVLTPPQRTKYTEISNRERGERTKASISKRVNVYKVVLALADDKSEALRAALQETSDKMAELFQSSGHRGSRDEFHQAMDKLRKEQDEKIQAILTADQFDKYRLIDSLSDFRGRREGP